MSIESRVSCWSRRPILCVSVALLLLGGCAGVSKPGQGPAGRANAPRDSRDSGSFETRADDPVAFSLEPQSGNATYYFEAVNRSDRPIVRYRVFLPTIQDLRTTIPDRILGAAIPSRQMTSRGVEVQILADGTARLTVEPGGRVAITMDDLKNRNTKIFTYLPFAVGSRGVAVNATTTFRGPDGKQYPPGSYEFSDGTLTTRR